MTYFTTSRTRGQSQNQYNQNSHPIEGAWRGALDGVWALDDDTGCSQRPTSLGTTYEITVHSTENVAQTAKNRRYELLNEARRLLPGERVAHCQRGMINVSQPVTVNYSVARKRASFGNILSCGSVWHCPVCAARISEVRRIELQTGVDNWTAQGGATAMLSLTVQHEKHEPLSEVLADLTKAHGGLWSGRAGVALRAEFGIAGRVRAVEVTHGGNGWHPHAHVLLFLTRPLSELALNSLETAVSERWQKIVDRRYKRYASIERGAKLTFAGNNASGYITKIGRDWTAAHELAKAAVKVGRVDNRTPSKLLGDSLEGDTQATALWLEYAQTIKGRRQLVWSNGLRDLLSLAEPETDESLVEQTDADAMPMVNIGRDGWRAVLGNDIRGELIAVAAKGNQADVKQFLEQFNITDVEYPPWFDVVLNLETGPTLAETAKLFDMTIITQDIMRLEQ